MNLTHFNIDCMKGFSKTLNFFQQTIVFLISIRFDLFSPYISYFSVISSLKCYSIFSVVKYR